jgi:hypothetical protein
MAIAANATELETAAEAGFDDVLTDDVFEGLMDPAVPHGEGPGGIEAPNKFEKAVLLRGVVAPEVTSVNPPAYTLAELNHRFTHIKPAGKAEPIFPHPQV